MLREVPPVDVAALAAPPVTVEVLFNGGVDASRFARARVEAAVAEWREALVSERLAAEGIPRAALRPVELRAVDRAPEGAALARGIAVALVVLALTGAFFPALDLGTGEKERGTLETLLLAPAARVYLAMGKLAAVTTVASTYALLNVLSIGVTFTSASLLAGGMLPGIGVAPASLAVLLVVLLPLVVLFSALSLAISTFATSFKEAQAYLTPLMLVALGPAMAVMLPGLEPTPALCLVPVLGATLLTKALLAGTASAWAVLLVVGSSAVYAALGVRWVGALFEREEVLWRPAAAEGLDLLGLRARSGGRGEPTLAHALLLGLAVLVLLIVVGAPLQARGVVGGLVATLIGLVALPALATARALGCDLRATFRLRAAPPAAFAAAALLALGCLVLQLDVLRLVRGLVEVGPAELEAARKATAPLEALPWPALLLLLAVLPAVCEELLVRGFVLSGLRNGSGTVTAVVVSALIFAALHLDPVRLLPTFLMGLALGALVVRSGSLLPAIALHALYNAAALGLEPWLEALERTGLVVSGGELDVRSTWPLRAIGLGALGLGVALLVHLRPRSEPAAAVD